MATTQLGTTLSIGAGTITGSYYVDTRDNGDYDVDMEDVFDGSDGSRKTRLIFNRDAKIVLNLICLSGAAPATDFPKGSIAAHTDFSNYFVDDCRISKSRGAERVTVTLTNIGIS